MGKGSVVRIFTDLSTEEQILFPNQIVAIGKSALPEFPSLSKTPESKDFGALIDTFTE
jgi:hypothetical protein